MISRSLIEKGADVNKQTYNGNSALMIASSKGKTICGHNKYFNLKF